MKLAKCKGCECFIQRDEIAFKYQGKSWHKDCLKNAGHYEAMMKRRINKLSK